MRQWKHVLNIKYFWNSPDLTLEQRRDKIVWLIRRAPFYQLDDAEWGELRDRVNDLAAAEGVEAFDEAWDEIYDWADHNDVWIKTS